MLSKNYRANQLVKKVGRFKAKLAVVKSDQLNNLVTRHELIRKQASYLRALGM